MKMAGARRVIAALRPFPVSHRPRYDIVYDVMVVMDIDTVVAAMRSPGGASAALLRAVREGYGTLLLTVPLAIEYESVCRRIEHRLEAGFSLRQVEIFLDAIIGPGEPVLTHYLWRPQLRDPIDEMVLEAAVNGRANALVTFNRRDYGAAATQFGVEILLPREAITRIKQ